MNTEETFKKSSLKFYLSVFTLSIPFYLFGTLAESLTKWLLMNLPVSALMFVCPITAALILVYRKDKINGINELLKHVFDIKRIKRKVWYIPIFFSMPIMIPLTWSSWIS